MESLQYCGGFCHTLTWISNGCTWVPHPEVPSHLPAHPIPRGHPSAPALSTLSHASNLDWWSVSHIIYMFQLVIDWTEFKNYGSTPKIITSFWNSLLQEEKTYLIPSNFFFLYKKIWSEEGRMPICFIFHGKNSEKQPLENAILREVSDLKRIFLNSWPFK